MTFIERLKGAAQESVLIAVKWGLIILIILTAVNYVTKIRTAALNGEQAAIAIVEFQKKGWLPQIVNGQVPDKPLVGDMK